MGYPSTVDTGGTPPLIVATDAVSFSSNATNTLSTNAVYLFAFELAVSTTFSGGKWRVGATATGTTDIGIYSFAGTLQGTDTGAVTNTVSTSMSANFTGGNITLAPGQYFAALCVSNNTDLLSTSLGGNLAVMSHCRQATNNATAGVLPPTTGGYSDTPARFPAFALTVVSGLT